MNAKEFLKEKGVNDVKYNLLNTIEQPFKTVLGSDLMQQFADLKTKELQEENKRLKSDYNILTSNLELNNSGKIALSGLQLAAKLIQEQTKTQQLKEEKEFLKYEVKRLNENFLKLNNQIKDIVDKEKENQQLRKELERAVNTIYTLTDFYDDPTA